MVTLTIYVRILGAVYLNLLNVKIIIQNDTKLYQTLNKMNNEICNEQTVYYN